MSSVVMNAYNGSKKLGSATVQADRSLYWYPAFRWEDCDGLELCGSQIQSLWLVIRKGSVSPDRQNFPQQFVIVTPFFVWTDSTLALQRNNDWTLAGWIGVTYIYPLNLRINSTGILDFIDVTIFNGWFASDPPGDRELDITYAGGPNVRIAFAQQRDGNQSYFLQLRCGVVPRTSQITFWLIFKSASGSYNATFSYRALSYLVRA